MKSLDVISVNLWQILISLANLLILFLLVKKFLYAPVQKMLDKRENALKEKYDEAELSREKAMQDEKYWHDKMESLKNTIKNIIALRIKNYLYLMV